MERGKRAFGLCLYLQFMYIVALQVYQVDSQPYQRGSRITYALGQRSIRVYTYLSANLKHPVVSYWSDQVAPFLSLFA